MARKRWLCIIIVAVAIYSFNKNSVTRTFTSRSIPHVLPLPVLPTSTVLLRKYKKIIAVAPFSPKFRSFSCELEKYFDFLINLRPSFKLKFSRRLPNVGEYFFIFLKGFLSVDECCCCRLVDCGFDYRFYNKIDFLRAISSNLLRSE